MANDLYSALIGAPVDSAEKQAALADLLRRRAGFANVAQMTGDPALAPMGQQQAQQTAQQAQQLGVAARAQQEAAFQQQQEARIAAAQQQQMGLTERGQNLDYSMAQQQLAAQEAAARLKASTAGEKQPTEGERKNAALATRLEGALRELQSVGSTAQKPGVLEKTLGLISEPLANVSRSEERQRADAAQLDALDAALTLGTGASYTKEQLEGQRKAYFPQIGDGPKTIEQKQIRLEALVNAARAAAGRAAHSIDTSLAPNAAASASKVIGGKTYTKRDGKWYAD